MTTPVLLIAPEIISPRSMPAVGLGYIGAYLASKSESVRIVDSQFRKEDPFPVLQSSPPTLVGITMESRTYERALRLAREAKRYGHTTVLGGLHVSLIKEELLRDHPEVDYAIVGDGEVATWQLLRHLRGEVPASEVSGLMYRGPDGTIYRNDNTTEMEDLDLLPPPDYRLAGIRHIDLYPLVTSRDCPFKCMYCTVGQISNGRFRQRSPLGSVDEIVAAKERYGIRSFIVVDENFAYNIDMVRAFCQELIDREVNLPWTVFEGMRADCLTDDLLTLLKCAGCRWIFFGIETVENAVLTRIKKGEKFHHIQNAVDLARRHDFRVGGFLIIGLPGSTFDRDMQTLEWALGNLDKCTFWTAVPYRGTAMYHWVRCNARLLREPVGDNLVNTLSTLPFFETDEYPAEERRRAHVIASVRTGVQYFADFLDIEARERLSPEERTAEAQHARFVALLRQYDPSFLVHVGVDPGSPPYPDPFAIARQRAGGDDVPLPNDLYGPLGTPRTSSTKGHG